MYFKAVRALRSEGDAGDFEERARALEEALKILDSRLDAITGALSASVLEERAEAFRRGLLAGLRQGLEAERNRTAARRESRRLVHERCNDAHQSFGTQAA